MGSDGRQASRADRVSARSRPGLRATRRYCISQAFVGGLRPRPPRTLRRNSWSGPFASRWRRRACDTPVTAPAQRRAFWRDAPCRLQPYAVALGRGSPCHAGPTLEALNDVPRWRIADPHSPSASLRRSRSSSRCDGRRASLAACRRPPSITAPSCRFLMSRRAHQAGGHVRDAVRPLTRNSAAPLTRVRPLAQAAATTMPGIRRSCRHHATGTSMRAAVRSAPAGRYRLAAVLALFCSVDVGAIRPSTCSRRVRRGYQATRAAAARNRAPRWQHQENAPRRNPREPDVACGARARR